MKFSEQTVLRAGASFLALLRGSPLFQGTLVAAVFFTIAALNPDKSPPPPSGPGFNPGLPKAVPPTPAAPAAPEPPKEIKLKPSVSLGDAKVKAPDSNFGRGGGGKENQ